MAQLRAHLWHRTSRKCLDRNWGLVTCHPERILGPRQLPWDSQRCDTRSTNRTRSLLSNGIFRESNKFLSGFGLWAMPNLLSQGTAGLGTTWHCSLPALCPPRQSSPHWAEFSSLGAQSSPPWVHVDSAVTEILFFLLWF